MREYDNYNLLNHNTFGIDVTAKRFVEYGSEDELRAVLSTLGKDEPVLHIGGGSNLLFTGNYGGTVLHSAIGGTEVVDEDGDVVLLRVGAGVVWDELVAYAVERGWGGIENLSLIPGEVGASAVQNIGAYGVEAKDVIALVEAVELATGQKRCFGNAECDYAYRQSIFKRQLKGKYAITYVTYRLQKKPVLKLEYGNLREAVERIAATTPTASTTSTASIASTASRMTTMPNLSNESERITIADVRQAIIDIRNAKLPDPKVLGNAGSFFMNPVVSQEKHDELKALYPTMPSYPAPNGVKLSAGWMIDQCGWKGRSLGRAAVHDKQALVLVNLGGAKSEEIIALCDAVCKDVKEKFGVDIHPEVNFI